MNDDATGMDLLGARCYVPALGRFLTQDPVGQEGGLNLYAYCDDSPLLRADPKGTWPDWLDRGWVRFSYWFSGQDRTTPMGHPVRIGGWPALLNWNGNVMTINGTMHVDDINVYQMFLADRHWQLHEEGHIKQGFNMGDLPTYILAQAMGYGQELITMAGGPSRGGRTGHDYNIYETYAEDHARGIDGIWGFGSPPRTSTQPLEYRFSWLPWNVKR